MRKNWQRTKEYKELNASLSENLTARGLTEKVYADKQAEYLNMWVQLQELREDIAERGVTVWDEKRNMYVENRSVTLSINLSRQMLAIYTALGFKDIAAKAQKQETDDDEL